ncbi:hydrogenase maturation protease [Streptomyces sp. NPDC050564]|uniref:hydrogenase maturation protease n=1 Tax=Streptomyces sp. NPDC050564 TaxID=3365631 RepID=UPI0037A8D07D
MADALRIVVIGVGNEFRHDDGVGWAVIARLKEHSIGRSSPGSPLRSSSGDPFPPGTVLETCDGDPGRLLGLWENADLAIVLDAGHAHPPHPGRVHRLALDGTRPVQVGTTSSHGLGLGEAVELSRVLGRLPGRLVVYAVEGADGTLGTGLSAPVAAQVNALARSVVEEIERYRSGRPEDVP